VALHLSLKKRGEKTSTISKKEKNFCLDTTVVSEHRKALGGTAPVLAPDLVPHCARVLPCSSVFFRVFLAQERVRHASTHHPPTHTTHSHITPPHAPQQYPRPPPRYPGQTDTSSSKSLLDATSGRQYPKQQAPNPHHVPLPTREGVGYRV